MEIGGSVAIVTGASSGIGLATARLLTERGARVALVARSRDLLGDLAGGMSGSWARPTDMTDTADIARMVVEVWSHYGRIDILVNNAGQGYDASIERVKPGTLRHIVELDLIGPLVAMQQVIPVMRAQGRGSIVNISSGTALMHLENMGAYAAIKAALAHLSLTARAELARSHIGVSVVYPYMTLTDFERKTLREPGGEMEMEPPGAYRPPPADTPEFVAGKIVEAVTTNAAEVFAHDWMLPSGEAPEGEVGGIRGGWTRVTVRVGTCGWQYPHWRAAFYPAGLPQKKWLAYYASSFGTVEVDSTFYRLPDRAVFERWAAATPAGFEFALKASRYLTHIRRLRDPGPPVQRLVEAAAGLGEHVGPLLLQLSPTHAADIPALEATLDAIPAHLRVAVEPRHPSWFGDGLYDLLSRRDAALCLTDRRDVAGAEVATASWGYLRLHEGTGRPRPCYRLDRLRWWAEQVVELWGDGTVYVFFNNDGRACALRDAICFAGEARRAGAAVSAVPARRAVHVAAVTAGGSR